jgi:hypothetical protein
LLGWLTLGEIENRKSKSKIEIEIEMEAEAKPKQGVWCTTSVVQQLGVSLAEVLVFGLGMMTRVGPGLHVRKAKSDRVVQAGCAGCAGW